MNFAKLMAMAPKLISAFEKGDLGKIVATVLPMLSDEHVKGMAERIKAYWLDQQAKVPGKIYRLTLEPNIDTTDVFFSTWLYDTATQENQRVSTVALSTIDKATIEDFIKRVLSGMGNDTVNDQKLLADGTQDV